MEKLIIVIEKSSDHYSAYSENCDGIYGGGDSVDDVKKNALEGLRLYKETTNKIPELLQGEYEIVYKYDIPSFLQYYSKVLSLSGLERLTGVNQGQLSHYINGYRKPSKKTAERIESALHNFGKELSQVEFV